MTWRARLANARVLVIAQVTSYWARQTFLHLEIADRCDWALLDALVTVQELGESCVVTAAASMHEAVIAGCTRRLAFGAIVVEWCVAVRTFAEAFGQVQIRVS